MPLLNDTTAESIFYVIDDYFNHHAINWQDCYLITSDGCPSMLGKNRGIVALGIIFLFFNHNDTLFTFSNS